MEQPTISASKRELEMNCAVVAGSGV